LEPPTADARDPLEYEAPVFVEHRRPPSLAARLAIFPSVMLAASAIALLVVARHGRAQSLLRILALVELVIAVVLPVFLSAIYSTTLVYPDRIQIYLRVAAFRLWQHSYRWPDIKQADLFLDWRTAGHEIPGDRSIPTRRKPVAILSFGLGCTFVMFGGNGLRLLLTTDHRVLVGSDRPEELADAVDRAMEFWRNAPGSSANSGQASPGG
jgi:hypothetical protein